MDIKNINFKKLFEAIYIFESNKNNLNKFKYQNELQILKNIVNQAKILFENYDIVITNPPYMGSSGMNPNLKDYLKKNFPDSKSDLFAVFIEKCHKFSKSNGFVAMITQQSFMFLSTFEKIRVDLINTHTIIDMVHLGAHAFEEIGGEVVQATSFINRNNFIKKYNSTFHRLTEFNSESKKEQEFHNDGNNHIIKQGDFDKIPGSPIAYWVDDNIVSAFTDNYLLKDVSILKSGRSTSGENDRIFKLWFEVDFNQITFDALNLNQIKFSYVPLNKGGSYRKWYGNKDYVSLKEFVTDSDFEFRESITWSDINSSNFSARLHESGLISNNVGKRAYFEDKSDLLYNLGYLNTNFCQFLLNLIIPTIHFDIGYVGKIPVKYHNKLYVVNLVKDNINITKNDWNDYELSWDFKKHPFLNSDSSSLVNIFNDWSNFKQNQFKLLKSNEIELNKFFNLLFNVSEIIDDDVDDKKISINNSDYNLDIRSFISYAVGCMFGRYSLDEEGLQFAGGNFDLNKYNKFIPDYDNIIPVLDSEYFDDDIVGRFVEFVKTCFGEETLEENLDFIANALSKNKKPSREKIRDYLLKNFFNDHKKTYKKCPIYWQFSSGKQNGFNCLVYMHRYEPSLVARIRTDYLHKTQQAIEQSITNCDNIINNSSSNIEIKKATKDKIRLQKQLKETQEYDEALAHIANQNIEIDLDDGVKVNYAKFQNIEVSREGKKSKKINLLKKL